MPSLMTRLRDWLGGSQQDDRAVMAERAEREAARARARCVRARADQAAARWARVEAETRSGRHVAWEDLVPVPAGCEEAET